MAFVSTTLQSALVTIFTAMDAVTDGSGNEYLAEKLAAAIKTYTLTGQASTMDAGSAAAGTYAGAGVGTMTIDAENLESDLLETFDAGYDDDELAAHMAADIDTACSEEGTVKVTSSGTVTTPAGATSNLSGPGTGTFSGDKSIIEEDLKGCFAAMKSMAAVGGNALYALQFSMCFTTYLTAGKVEIDLEDPPFASGSGEGKIA
jgi:hypothetical protein